MPQMGPLLWMNLFVFFTIMFILFLVMNFYLKPLPTKLDIQPTHSNPKLSWKW